MARICIAGGGNLGTLLAAEWAAAGHEVVVLTSHPAGWSKRVQALDATGNVVAEGPLALVTNDCGRALAGADLVLVTHPQNAQVALAKAMAPHVRAGLDVCVVPGALAEFTFAPVRRAGASLWGLERVPAIVRIGERGRSAIDLGTKPSASVATLPGSELSRARKTLHGLLAMPVHGIDSYLALSLIPSNPVLHTTRLATLFGHWHPGDAWDENPAFYETWDDASSEALIEADGEVQSICRSLEQRARRAEQAGQAEQAGLSLDLSAVRPLTVHYEAPTVAAMTAKIRSIAAFKGLPSPMIRQSDGRWMPDFGSRYFKADFAFGLKAMVDFARLARVEAPRLNRTLAWYCAITDEVGAKAALFEGVPSTLQELWDVYR